MWKRCPERAGATAAKQRRRIQLALCSREYSVSAERAASEANAHRIELKVDQPLTFALAPPRSGVSESVEVSSHGALVESATSSLGQVIENRKILDLPLNETPSRWDCSRATIAGGGGD
jgi:hypothetical protein